MGFPESIVASTSNQPLENTEVFSGKTKSLWTSSAKHGKSLGERSIQLVRVVGNVCPPMKTHTKNNRLYSGVDCKPPKSI